MGKRWWLFASLIAVLPAYAGPFTEFRIPTHRVYSLWGDAAGSYNDNHNNAGGYSTNNWQYSGRLGGSGAYLYDSDPLRAAANLNASFQGDRTRMRSENFLLPTNYTHDGDDVKRVTESWSANGDVRYFPWIMPLGLTVGGSGSGSYVQQWTDENSDSYTETDSRYWQNQQHSSVWEYNYSVSGSGGIGWGRVRDATVVYLVHVAEVRLLETGAITRGLSSATREKLAALWYYGKDMGQVHDRYARYYWDEFERILRADGALKDGLDAYSLYRIAEPVFGGNVRSVSYPDYTGNPPLRVPRGGAYSGFPRYQGYFIGLAASEYHSHQIRREDRTRDQYYHSHDSTDHDSHTLTEYHYRVDQSHDEFAIGPRAEYRLPLGWRWQFDVNSSVLFPFHNHAHAIRANSSATASYLIADRWYGQFRFYHSRSINREKASDYLSDASGYRDMATWQTNAQASVAFYVEDRLSLSLGLEQQQYVTETNYSPNLLNMPSHNFTRNHTVSLGLSYHFLGQMDAPILSAPVKMLPVQWPF
jgi:hypothetical protein